MSLHLKQLQISGFKSFAKKASFDFESSVVAVVGPNGSGKSNVAESIRFVLGEQSMKSMRGKRGEDLIWNGSNAVPRASRASVVITFNNATRFLDIDFDEVVIERTVHRDGVNEYRLNGTQVRLKDILELLAGANIGQTGHHIISQGEADKILSASTRERREMLEDALGLKVFQYKKEESVRKLEKTKENMRQVEALRREVHPHIRFLKRQVDKIEKAETLREEGAKRFQSYFKQEETYLASERAFLEENREVITKNLEVVAQKIAEAKSVLAKSSDNAEGNKIVVLSEKLETFREEKQRVVRDAARIDGQIETLRSAFSSAAVNGKAVRELLTEAEHNFASAQSSLETLSQFVTAFFGKLRTIVHTSEGGDTDIQALKEQKTLFDEKEKSLAEEERVYTAQLEKIRQDLDASRASEREKERGMFELTAKERDLRFELATLVSKEESVTHRNADFERDLTEAASLIGREVLRYEDAVIQDLSPEDQEKEKRELEKIKIRLEEMGAGGGEDVLKEYEEAVARETFLEKELHDLTSSAESLKSLIEDLEAELRVRFKEGMDAINKEFARFFGLMFDGGTASLIFTKEAVRRPKSLIDENDDGVPDEMEKTVDGVDLSLSIPRKRIKSLTMLSGGERALTSIALIFAMSSVNPPPFLILDETDAALDEANSRRYGDMVAALAEKSQLMLITHNRETMSRASILYGVTMGGDGVSKILSVKLEDAVKVAK